MAKLKLGAIADDKSLKLTVEPQAAVHRDLFACTEILAHDSGRAGLCVENLRSLAQSPGASNNEQVR